MNEKGWPTLNSQAGGPPEVPVLILGADLFPSTTSPSLSSLSSRTTMAATNGQALFLGVPLKFVSLFTLTMQVRHSQFLAS